MSLRRIDHILAEVDAFPSMPAAGAKMLQILENPDASVEEIESVLHYDPGLTANVLRLANSAYFGIPSKIGSIRQAVILLGLKRLGQLVVATCVSSVMREKVPGYHLPPGDLWHHSIAVAVTAEALVKDKRSSADDIFAPALLHDVGKLVLGKFVKDELAEIEDMVAKGIPRVIVENMVIGVDHAEIGARVLEGWSFPTGIVNAVRWHHDPDGCGEVNLQIDVVYLANLLCQANDMCCGSNGGALELSPAVIDRLGIEMKEFESISDKMADWVNELSDSISFG
jgi:putative nucleotidyltransferase with HDIG domain